MKTNLHRRFCGIFSIILVALATLCMAGQIQAQTTITSLVATTPGNAAPTNAVSVQYTATFAQAITGLTVSNFSLVQSGSVSGASVSSVTGSGTTWVITVGSGTGDGTIQLVMVNATNVDLSVTNLPFSGATYTIDKTPPTVSISVPSVVVANSSTSVSYTVTYADASAISNISIAPIDLFLNTTFTGSANLNSLTVHPRVGNTQAIEFIVSGDGTVAFMIPANAATDAAGNKSVLSAVSPAFAADNTAPNVAIIRTNPSPIRDNVLDFQIVFSEPVTGVTADDFMMTNSGVATGAISVSNTGDSKTYNLTVIDVVGTGTVRLDLKNGTDIADAAGNAAAGFTGGEVYDVDQIAPTVSSITATTPSNTNPTNATNLVYTITFSESVTGVDTEDFTVQNLSGNATGTVSSISGSGDTYQITVGSISGNGTLRLDLNLSGTGIFDLATTPISGGFTSGDIYTIDNTPSTLISGSYFSNNTNSSQYAKVGDQITLTIGFNEPLQSLSMTIGGNPISVTPSNGNRNWTGVYTLTAGDIEGNVPWTLNCTDLAGNLRLYDDTNFGTFLTFDKTPPVPSISAPTPAIVAAGGTVTYNVTYVDANLNVSTLSISDITLNTTGTATGTVSLNGSGANYTVTVSNITGTGTVGISIAANTAVDIPGNIADASAASTTFDAVLVLPVTWLSFDVQQVDNLYYWNWALATEENVAYYVPQYSTDGTHFIDAGKITQLNSNLTYHFSASLALTGNTFFRVKEVDKDGKFTYSEIRTLKATASKKVSFYPNPAMSEIWLHWPYADASSLTIVIYDNKGGQVLQQKTALSFPLKISLAGLAKGTYFIYCVDDKQRRLTAQPLLKVVN